MVYVYWLDMPPIPFQGHQRINLALDPDRIVRPAMRVKSYDSPAKRDYRITGNRKNHVEGKDSHGRQFNYG